MKKSLLWCVTPPDDSAPSSYLFGTMHVRDLRAFGWLPVVQEKIASCDLFATEFDFAEIDPALMETATRLKNDETLENLLKPGVWKRLQKLGVKKLGLQPEMLLKQHPMMLSAALSNAMMQEEAELSLDESLWQFARGLNIPTTGVESFREQIKVLQHIPMKQHLRHLGWLVKNYPQQKRRLKKMLHWYNEGDIQQLYRLAKKDSKGMRKILLYDRNKHMAQRFGTLARDQAVFCAIGAGHLAGGKGVLRLLKQNGFDIKAIR